MIALRAAPILPGSVMVDLTPVDELARVVIAVCLLTTEDHHARVQGRVMNVTAGQRQMSWLIERLVASCPSTSSITLLPWREWQAALVSSMGDTASSPSSPSLSIVNPLHPLIAFFSGRGFPGAVATRTADTLAVLSACHIPPPSFLSEDALSVFFKRIIASIRPEDAVCSRSQGSD